MSRRLTQRAKRWFWAATVAYGGAVAYMSLRPFGTSPVERAIDSVGRAYFHLPAYAGLAVLVALALAPSASRGRRAAVAAVCATLYGWLLEVAQIPAPTRSFNLEGLLFDAAGAVAGSVVAFWLLVALESRRVGRRRLRP